VSAADRPERWRTDAACRGYPLDWFFPATRRAVRRGRLESTAVRQQSEALAVCARCPVRDECLDYAIRYDELGVWGGTTDAQRRRIRNARRAAGERLPSRPETGLLPAGRGRTGEVGYVAGCGTDAAYRRHLRNGETPCRACLLAAAAAQAGREAARSVAR
jgi:WhiB family redox-sensing transcriptional regulator